MTAFFDTNILVYAQSGDRKGEIAREVVSGGGWLSVQVLNEFVSVLARKQRKTWAEIEEAVTDVLAIVEEPIPLTLPIHHDARRLAADHTLSFYDALIVAAAFGGGCTVLYSEDLQAGRRFGPLTIVNPFAVP